MIRTRHQREVHLGMATDPMFGAVIAFGAGGVAVEQIDDVAIGLPPLNASLARALVQRTRVHRLLRAYRNVPSIDFGLLEQTMVRFSALVCACPWIASLDVNPLVVDEDRAIALDARIEVRPPGQEPAVRWRGAYGHLAIHPYPRELEETVTLKNGATVLLRPIRPEDAELERAFVAALSPQTLYRRFMMPVKELSPQLIERFTQIDYDRELALVALHDEDGGPPGGANSRIVGVARIIPTWEDGVAEFAIVVGDWMQHSGLGRELMTRMFEACRTRGYRIIEGAVLGENLSMLRFCERLGFTVRFNPTTRPSGSRARRSPDGRGRGRGRPPARRPRAQRAWSAAQASAAQPAMNAAPPIGVIAPSPRHAGQRERVQAAAEEHRAGHEQPARHVRAAPGPGGGGLRDRQQRERVREVVARRGVPHREQVGAEPGLERVGAEGAGGDGQGGGQCAGGGPGGVHRGRSWKGRGPGTAYRTPPAGSPAESPCGVRPRLGTRFHGTTAARHRLDRLPGAGDGRRRRRQRLPRRRVGGPLRRAARGEAARGLLQRRRRRQGARRHRRAGDARGLGHDRGHLLARVGTDRRRGRRPGLGRGQPRQRAGGGGRAAGGRVGARRGGAAARTLSGAARRARRLSAAPGAARTGRRR
jgi:RimJ/RimL family protein N-acetyltransferase